MHFLGGHRTGLVRHWTRSLSPQSRIWFLLSIYLRASGWSGALSDRVPHQLSVAAPAPVGSSRWRAVRRTTGPWTMKVHWFIKIIFEIDLFIHTSGPMHMDPIWCTRLSKPSAGPSAQSVWCASRPLLFMVWCAQIGCSEGFFLQYFWFWLQFFGVLSCDLDTHG
jgi:hypothetical protein